MAQTMKPREINDDSGSETISTADSWEDDDAMKLTPRKSSPTALLKEIVRIHGKSAYQPVGTIHVELQNKNGGVSEVRPTSPLPENNDVTPKTKGRSLFCSMSNELQRAMYQVRKVGKVSEDESPLYDATNNTAENISSITKGIKQKLTLSKLNSVKCLIRNVVAQGDKRNQETAMLSSIVVDSQNKETPLQDGGCCLKADIKSTGQQKLNIRTAHELSHARANRLMKEKEPFTREFLPVGKSQSHEDQTYTIPTTIMAANHENPILASRYNYDAEENTKRFKIMSKNYNLFFDDEAYTVKSAHVDWKSVEMSKEKCIQWFDKYFVHN